MTGSDGTKNSRSRAGHLDEWAGIDVNSRCLQCRTSKLSNTSSHKNLDSATPNQLLTTYLFSFTPVNNAQPLLHRAK